jgi:DNA-binding FadR family transcriptional regulator
VRLMKYWLHQMDLAEGNLEAHGLSALEIHRTIAEASGNALLRSVTGIVELTLALALKSLDGTSTAPYCAAALAAHTALVGAIEAGTAAPAALAGDAVIVLDNERAMTLC